MKRFAVFALSLFLMLTLAEIGLRSGHAFYSRDQTEQDMWHGAEPHSSSSISIGGRSSDRTKAPRRRVLRIVAIGESTTAPYAALGERESDNSWPALLQPALEAEFQRLGLGIAVQVLNRGRSATSSGFLVESLAADIEELNPDIVISMMGVNDTNAFPVKRSWLYQHSFLARFIYWSYRYSDCPRCFSYSMNGMGSLERGTSRPLTRRETSALEIVLKRFENWKASSRKAEMLPEVIFGGLDEAKQVLKSRSMASDFEPIVKLFAGVEIFEWSTSGGASDEQPATERAKSEHTKSERVKPEDRREVLRFAGQLIREARAEVQKDFSEELVYYCHIQHQLAESCMSEMLLAFRSGVKPTTGLLNVLMYDSQSDNEEFLETMRALGWRLERHRSTLELTRESYLKLKALVADESKRRGRGLVWIGMQYPTGHVDGLVGLMKADWKSLFSEQLSFKSCMLYRDPKTLSTKQAEDFYLVSHQNFSIKVMEKLKTPEGEGYYFRDYFGRAMGLNFGHTTKAGADLIVENIVEQMRPFWPNVLEFTEDSKTPASKL